MKCDECVRLLVREDSPGSGEADRLGATLKFHPGCYGAARRKIATPRPESRPPRRGRNNNAPRAR
jgi:hypothetical protein